MARRLLLVLVLLAGAGPPLVPFLNSLGHFDSTPFEWGRLLSLAGHTAALIGLVALWTLPLATLFAVLLGGTDLIGRRGYLATVFIAMAIPLPMFAVAWQGVSLIGWRPFDTGLGPAAIVHSLAAIPWLIAILVVNLNSSDPALVDNARISASGYSRLFLVVLPKMRSGIMLGAIWLMTTVASEIVVTDLMQVRTFAEEVYAQFVSPAIDGTPSAELATSRAVFISLPSVLVLTVGCVVLLRRSKVTPFYDLSPSPPLLQLAQWRGLSSVLVVLVITLFLVTPGMFLILRAGSAPPLSWSLEQLISVFNQVVRDTGTLLFWSICFSLMTGILTTSVVFAICWSARSSVLTRYGLFFTALITLVTPAPIIGLGIKAIINWLMIHEDRVGSTLIASWLYDGPSYIPVIWTWFVRSFPIALAILWPMCRDWPRALPDALRMESRSNWALFRHVFWPLGRKTLLFAVLLVSFFSFGEVSASRLTATPGAPTFAHDMFERMHFGMRPDLAATCLLGITAVGLVAIVGSITIKQCSKAD